MKPSPVVPALCRILIVILLLGLTGCAPRLIQASKSQRTESFAPYSGTQIDGQPIVKYLGTRTSLILRADDVELTRTGDNSGTVKFLRNQPGGAGTATAIDPRGYFLTAAHCIPEIIPLLFFHADGKTQAERPRIVWMGRVSQGEPDLALLYVPFALPSYFTWADNLKSGEKIVTTGYYMEEKFHLKAQDLAGKILELQRKSTKDLSFTRILHDVPIIQGNSGGPAVNLEGKLVGINVAWEGQLQLLSYTVQQRGGVALRPDIKWLTQLIDKDQAWLDLRRKLEAPR